MRDRWIYNKYEASLVVEIVLMNNTACSFITYLYFFMSCGSVALSFDCGISLWTSMIAIYIPIQIYFPQTIISVKIMLFFLTKLVVVAQE